jgi:hypothetical protein
MIMKLKPVKEKKKKKKRSKSERKTLEALLWKLTADFVKKRDACCVTCGATEGLTISHWIKAGKQQLRYDVTNCNCQCSTCNNTHNYYTYHYDNYMLRTYGTIELIKLTERARINGFRWSVLELREMVDVAQARLEGME